GTEIRRSARRAASISTGVSAADVILEMRYGRALAGDDPFYQIADRDHADDLILIQHRQMANAFVSHKTETFFDRLTRMGDSQIGRHDLRDPGFSGTLAAEQNLFRVVAFRKHSVHFLAV